MEYFSERTPSVGERFATLPDRLDPAEYNYGHFRTRHLIHEVERTLRARGIAPGAPAPDFVLPRADGGALRLSDLRGRPVLLHFGSYT